MRRSQADDDHGKRGWEVGEKGIWNVDLGEPGRGLSAYGRESFRRWVGGVSMGSGASLYGM